MALQIAKMDRQFLYKKNGKELKLTDPNPEMSPEDVMKFYAGVHPELTNGVIDGPVITGDKTNYTMTTKAGKLG